MAITYHPTLGEALWCDYSGTVPEMVKRRLVIVVVPRASQRHSLTTVVPISATAPPVIRPWHVHLTRDPYPLGTAPDLWVKCDMINVVCFSRLSGHYTRWNNRRQYKKMAVDGTELQQIRAGILASLGLP